MSAENYCPTHNLFFKSACPYCLEDDSGFSIKLRSDLYQKYVLLLKEKQTHTYGKPFDWNQHLLELCNYKQEDGFTYFNLSTDKLLQRGKFDLAKIVVETTKTLTELFSTKKGYYETEVGEEPPFESLGIDLTKLSTFVSAVKDLWKSLLTVQISTDTLLLTTKSPAFSQVLMKAWTKPLSVTDPEGKTIIELERPMEWQHDISSLESAEFTVSISDKAIEKLKLLAQAEEVLYKTVTINAHEEGLLIRVYKYLDKEYRDKLEKNCKIIYYKVYPDDYEELQFIQRKPDLDEGVQIAYVAKYFTFPVLRSYFKKEGFNVIVDPKLITELPKLPFTMIPNYKPYDIQLTAISNWVKNDNVGTIIIPTGGGKTHSGLLAIEGLKTWTLVVVPTVEIMQQWKSFLHDSLSVPYEYIGEFWGMKKEIKPITIALFQSAHKYAAEPEEEEGLSKDEILELETFGEELGKITDKFGLFLCDEGHHLAAPLWKKVAINLKCLNRLSLTATPERYDGNEGLLFFTMGDVIYKTTYGELAEKKIVSPISFAKVTVELNPLEKQIINTLGDLKWKKQTGWGGDDQLKETLTDLYLDLPYMKAKEKKWFEEQKKKVAKGKIKAVPDEMPVNQISIRIVHLFAENKFNELRKIVEKHRFDKVLVFNEMVAGTQLILDKISDIKPEARILTGSTPYEERQEIFQSFKDSLTGCIVTTTVLDEGINVPDCNVIVIFNGRRRRRQMIQRIGRGCRFGKFKIEYVYEIVTRRESKVGKGEEIEEPPKKGETLYIIGGVQGSIGEAVTFEHITGSSAIVRNSKGVQYDKQLTNVSHTPHGKPLSEPKYSYGTYGKQAMINEMLDYESNISDERDPSEVLEFDKQKILIDNVTKEILAAPMCKIKDCANHVFLENTNFCMNHFAAKETLKLLTDAMKWTTVQEMYQGLKNKTYGPLPTASFELMVDITRLLADRQGVKLE